MNVIKATNMSFRAGPVHHYANEFAIPPIFPVKPKELCRCITQNFLPPKMKKFASP